MKTDPEKPIYAVFVKHHDWSRSYVSEIRWSQRGADQLLKRINEAGVLKSWVVRYPNRQAYLEAGPEQEPETAEERE